MNIFYRISFGSYQKERIKGTDGPTGKIRCFFNFLRNCFDPEEDVLWLVLDKKSTPKEIIDRWHLLAESVKSELPSLDELAEDAKALDKAVDNIHMKWVELVSQQVHHPVEIVERTIADASSDGGNLVLARSDAGSSALSFRQVMQKALTLPESDIVYFVEDDYLHLPDSRKVLLEGLDRAHYVTLYNHPDKYLPASKGGNPLVGDDAAEETKVFVTPSSYWMLTNSTTMTFATTVETLRTDQDVWWGLTEGSYPQDMNIFLELRRRGRSLIQPIPTKATHCEPQWAASLIGTGVTSWEDVLA